MAQVERKYNSWKCGNCRQWNYVEDKNCKNCGEKR